MKFFKLQLLVLFHHVIVMSLGVCTALCIVFQPLMVSIPIAIMVGRIATSASPCYLTLMENKMRAELGMKQIRGFIKHYYIERKGL